VRLTERVEKLSKYRRIEVNAYRRRVTIVSGEWRARKVFDAQPTQPDDRVSLSDSDSSEPVAPDSPEGQTILLEAVRLLERRPSPEARAMICADRNALTSNDQNQNRTYPTCDPSMSLFQKF
jgi:hypothetical protein